MDDKDPMNDNEETATSKFKKLRAVNPAAFEVYGIKVLMKNGMVKEAVGAMQFVDRFRVRNADEFKALDHITFDGMSDHLAIYLDPDHTPSDHAAFTAELVAYWRSFGYGGSVRIVLGEKTFDFNLQGVGRYKPPKIEDDI